MSNFGDGPRTGTATVVRGPRRRGGGVASVLHSSPTSRKETPTPIGNVERKAR